MTKRYPDLSTNGHGVDLFTPVSTNGSITTGGVAQVVAANNPSRREIIVVNNSAGDMWANINATAGPAGLNGSNLVSPGGKKEDEATGYVSLYGATGGQTFTVIEE